MKVIVAGFPKTGTKSMVAALTRLGYKVYDYVDNVYLLEKEWTKIANGGWTTEDFRQMYDDVDAVTDFPACALWEEIYRAFPDAKVNRRSVTFIYSLNFCVSFDIDHIDYARK